MNIIEGKLPQGYYEVSSEQFKQKIIRWWQINLENNSTDGLHLKKIK